MNSATDGTSVLAVFSSYKFYFSVHSRLRSGSNTRNLLIEVSLFSK